MYLFILHDVFPRKEGPPTTTLLSVSSYVACSIFRQADRGAVSRL